jgi:hypothetical protein
MIATCLWNEKGLESHTSVSGKFIGINGQRISKVHTVQPTLLTVGVQEVRKDEDGFEPAVKSCIEKEVQRLRSDLVGLFNRHNMKTNG